MQFLKTKKNTREKIKEATFELLATKGYAQISMRDIAKKAQTAVGQLTYYYGTKEYLIGSVVDEMISSFISELKSHTKDAEDKLNNVSDFFVELYENESGLFKILIDFTAQALWNNNFKEKINKFYEESISTIKDVFLENGCDENLAKSKANYFMATVYGTVIQKILCDKKENTDELINHGKKISYKERLIFNAKRADGLL